MKNRYFSKCQGILVKKCWQILRSIFVPAWGNLILSSRNMVLELLKNADAYDNGDIAFSDQAEEKMR